MNNQRYLSFAHEQYELDWSNVLCAKFGVVQGLNVFVGVTQFGPFNISISENLYREEWYVQILNDIVLPFLAKKDDIIYVQESNVFTTSDVVRKWFAMHPDVNCITWPSNVDIISPIALQWANMNNYLKNNSSLRRRETKQLMNRFWGSLKESDDLKNSFTNMRETLEMVKNEQINFVREHSHLDWKKILFVRFDTVRCVNVLVAVGQSGPFNISIADGLISEERYLKILNDIMLLFLTENKDIIYVQESNEVTKSVKVCSWFKMRPQIRYITWPSIISPISHIWENMNEFVDENFPLTGSEIKRLIFHFFEELKTDNPSYHLDCFSNLKHTFANIIENGSSE